MRPVHPFPSVSDIIQSIPASAACFAKLDATHGYFQFPLDEEASKLTTFILPSGRFRYLRAPMGLSSSSDEWCRHSDRVVEGFPWFRKIVDDIRYLGLFSFWVRRTHLPRCFSLPAAICNPVQIKISSGHVSKFCRMCSVTSWC